jgi:PPM family protein phosphatase
VVGVEWGARTDVGNRRARNEDSYLAAPPLFVVADGMGGHEGGELASSLAVSTLSELGEAPTMQAVQDVVGRANAVIRQVEADRPELSGMGTTLVGIVAIEEQGQPYWLAFNIGDSRLYRFANGSLSIVSHDHSVVQELIDAGELQHDEVATHPDRSVVTRALGSDPAPIADYWLLPSTPGETFLLCSDGLTGEVSDDRIAAILGSASGPEAAASQLVSTALVAGGRDNVTALVVQTGSGGSDGWGRVSDDTVERPSSSTRDRSGPDR